MNCRYFRTENEARVRRTIFFYSLERCSSFADNAPKRNLPVPSGPVVPKFTGTGAPWKRPRDRLPKLIMFREYARRFADTTVPIRIERRLTFSPSHVLRKKFWNFPRSSAVVGRLCSSWSSHTRAVTSVADGYPGYRLMKTGHATTNGDFEIEENFKTTISVAFSWHRLLRPDVVYKNENVHECTLESAKNIYNSHHGFTRTRPMVFPKRHDCVGNLYRPHKS